MNAPEACVRAEAGADNDEPEITRLRRRGDFQRAARGHRVRMEAFALQANRRPDAPDEARDAIGARVGFTVTKKLGGAVLRNRIRRRLKEALRLSPDVAARPDHDYVVMAQKEALRRRFDLLRTDLARAFALVHSRASRAGSARPSNDRDKRR
ncbi:MAG: ribonuclease P protein component [Roseiarcus sp.]|jgi:ribonuclease P protein component